MLDEGVDVHEVKKGVSFLLEHCPLMTPPCLAYVVHQGCRGMAVLILFHTLPPPFCLLPSPTATYTHQTASTMRMYSFCVRYWTRLGERI